MIGGALVVGEQCEDRIESLSSLAMRVIEEGVAFSIVMRAGATKFCGILRTEPDFPNQVMFTGQNGSTLCVALKDLSTANVRAKLAESMACFAEARIRRARIGAL